MTSRSIVVTGGAGFIGSALCRQLIRRGDTRVINVDKLTYAGNPRSLAEAERSSAYRFVRADISNGELLSRLFDEERPDAVIHLAAESHVDRSIDGPAEFIETNIVGTFRLLEVAIGYWRSLAGAKRTKFRFHHVSTDEVFGDLPLNSGVFTEATPYRPSSPYSASKAASDHLVRAWHHTYGLPTIVSNCSNNYGPYQYPEKLVPLIILNAIHEKPLPVYGRGANIRDWLHVDDHAEALDRVVTEGKPGETYLIGGGAERTNLQVVRTICGLLDARRPRPSGRPYTELIEFVADRPGHDRRYAVDGSKAMRELGWRPAETFESGIAKTIDWYLGQSDWWEPLRFASGAGARLGTGR